MSPLYFLIFCAPLAAVAQPRASTDKCPAIAKRLFSTGKPMTVESHGVDEFYPIGTICLFQCLNLLLKKVQLSSAYCCCRRSSSPAKSRREAPPSPQMSNPVVEKASRRDPDEQLEFQGGELR